MLIAKAILDGVASILFAASLGKGVYLSIVPIFFYQGGITLMARFIRPWLTDVLIGQMSCVGSVLIFAISLNLIFNSCASAICCLRSSCRCCFSFWRSFSRLSAPYKIDTV